MEMFRWPRPVALWLVAFLLGLVPGVEAYHAAPVADPDPAAPAAPTQPGPGVPQAQATPEPPDRYIVPSSPTPVVESWLEGLRLLGEIRFRPEYKGNFDFDRSTDDNREFVGQRIQFGFEKRFAEGLVMRVVLQDSRVWGGSPGSDTGLANANSDSAESTDLRHAWFELEKMFALPLDLRVGRQEFNYGDGRLIGPSNWGNVGRSFDGLRLKLSLKRWEAHLLGAVLAEEDSDGAGNNTSVGSRQSSGFTLTCDTITRSCGTTARTARELDDAYLSGFYNTLKFADWLHLDLYYFGIHKKWIPRSSPILAVAGAQVTTQDRARQRDDLLTFGSRITNRTRDGEATGSFDYTFEYAVQRGRTGEEIAASWDLLGLRLPQYDLAGNRVLDASGNLQTTPLYTEKRRYDAYAYAGAVGYTMKKFRIGVEGAIASGDHNRNDGVSATFNNLLPSNHGHYGAADLVGWANLRAASLDLSWKVGEDSKLRFQYWYIRKLVAQDGWYGASGALNAGQSTESVGNARFGHAVNSGGVVSSQSVGTLGRDLFHELDLTYSVRYQRVEWVFGYSLVYAGESIRAIKNEELADPAQRKLNFDPRAEYGFVQMTAKF